MDKYFIVCFLVFIAGFVDSIAGGGGVISLPAYLLAGLPPHIALGTNKTSSSMGTIVSCYRYFKNGCFDFNAVLVAVIGALIGSFLGANTSLGLSDKQLNFLVLCILPLVIIFLLTKKDLGTYQENVKSNKYLFYSFLIGLGIGFYDGLIGPGTGTFMAICFCLIGFDLKVATGNTKFVNLASNISAFITFLIHNQINFPLALTAGIFGILGNYIGSGLAIKNGARIIKPLFYLIIIILIFKLGLELFY